MPGMARFFVYLEEDAYISIKDDLTPETRTANGSQMD
jgi:hypothetical protein